jgi:hypothetical protein
VDLLVNSKKYGAGSKARRFKTDLEAEDFLASILQKGLFFRAKKLVLKRKEEKEKESKKKDEKSKVFKYIQKNTVN